jgi:hypothetical protein
MCHLALNGQIEMHYRRYKLYVMYWVARKITERGI